MNTKLISSQTTQAGSEPTHDQIALCAYYLWEKTGRNPGQALQHWLQAEKQLKQALCASSSRSLPANAPQARLTANGPHPGNHNRLKT